MDGAAKPAVEPRGYTLAALKRDFRLSDGQARYLMSRVPDSEISRLGEGQNAPRLASERAIRRLLPNLFHDEGSEAAS